MYNAKIILDSESACGIRLTTWELTYPRFVHAELMTHRKFCLSGESILEFELPSPPKGGNRRVHSMRLDDFADKWFNGARRYGAKPKKKNSLDWLDDNAWYDALFIAKSLGMRSAANINNMCKMGVLTAVKRDRSWLLQGKEIRRWRNDIPLDTRFDMRERLQNMRIRQLNEDTGDIQTAHVLNVFISGVKEVLTVYAGKYHVCGSADHLVYTQGGWKRLGDLATDDHVVVRKFGKRDGEKKDPLRLKKIDGKWRSTWQNSQRNTLITEDPLCRRCGKHPLVAVHHIVPVYEDSSLAFEPSNITGLCGGCHDDMHEKQGWQVSQGLYGALVPIDRIESSGVVPTYDLEISGKYPNFIANGVVVHNSRNASSSRAIPITKLMRQVSEDPASPVWWGKNQSGMQANEELDDDSRMLAKDLWLRARNRSLESVKELSDVGLHKQIANRVIEPWMNITVLVSATDFRNWFHLRDHKDAQPELRKVASMMRHLYESSKPKPLSYGEWHIPLITEEDKKELIERGYDGENLTYWLKKISVGRCARVSYLTHDGRKDFNEDIKLHDRLVDSGHWSPFEHVAMSMDRNSWGTFVMNQLHADQELGVIDPSRVGNFVGWKQYRKEFEKESGTYNDNE